MDSSYFRQNLRKEINARKHIDRLFLSQDQGIFTKHSTREERGVGREGDKQEGRKEGRKGRKEDT